MFKSKIIINIKSVDITSIFFLPYLSDRKPKKSYANAPKKKINDYDVRYIISLLQYNSNFVTKLSRVFNIS